MEPIVPPPLDSNSVGFTHDFTKPFEIDDVQYVFNNIGFPFTYEEFQKQLKEKQKNEEALKPATIAEYRINMCNRIHMMLDDIIADIKTKASYLKENNNIKELDDRDHNSDVSYMNIYSRIDDATNEAVRCVENFRTDWFRDWRDLARFDVVYPYVKEMEKRIKALNDKDDATNTLAVIAEYYNQLSEDQEEAKHMYTSSRGTDSTNPLKAWLVTTVLPQFNALIGRLRNVEQTYLKTMKKITGQYEGRVMQSVSELVAKMNSVYDNPLQATKKLDKYKTKADEMHQFLMSVESQNEFPVNLINNILNRNPPITEKDFNGYDMNVKTNLYEACMKIIKNSISVFNTPYQEFSKVCNAVIELNSLLKRMTDLIETYKSVIARLEGKKFSIKNNAESFTKLSSMENEYEELKGNYDAFTNLNVTISSIFYIIRSDRCVTTVQSLDDLHKAYLGLIYKYDRLYERMFKLALTMDLINKEDGEVLTIDKVESGDVYKSSYSYKSYKRVINEILSSYKQSEAYSSTVNRMIEYYKSAYESLKELTSARLKDNSDEELLAKISNRVEYWKAKLHSKEYEPNLLYVWNDAQIYLKGLIDLISDEDERERANAIVAEVAEEFRDINMDRQNRRFNKIQSYIDVIAKFNITTATPVALKEMEKYCNTVKITIQKLTDKNMGSDIVAKYEEIVVPKIEEIDAYKKAEVDIQSKMNNIRMLCTRLLNDYKHNTKFTNSSAQLEELAAKANADISDILTFCNKYIHSAVVAERPEMEIKFEKIMKCITYFKKYDNDARRYKARKDLKNYVATEQQRVDNGAIDLESKRVDVVQKEAMGNEAVLNSQAKRKLTEEAQAFNQEYAAKEQEERFLVNANDMAEKREDREFKQTMTTRKQVQSEKQQEADIGFRAVQADREHDMSQKKFAQEVLMQNSDSKRKDQQQLFDQQNKVQAVAEARHVFDENTATNRQANQFRHDEQNRALDNNVMRMEFADKQNQRQMDNARQKNAFEYQLNGKRLENETVKLKQGQQLAMFNATTKAQADLLQHRLAQDRLRFDNDRDIRADATRNRQIELNDNLAWQKLDDARHAANKERILKYTGMQQSNDLANKREDHAFYMNQANLERAWHQDELNAILNEKRAAYAQEQALGAQETARQRLINESNQFIENLKFQQAKLQQEGIKAAMSNAEKLNAQELANEAKADLRKAYENMDAAANADTDGESIKLFNDITEDIAAKFNTADLTNPAECFNAYRNYFNNLTGSLVKNVDLNIYDEPMSIKERIRGARFKTPINDSTENKKRSEFLREMVKNVDTRVNTTLGHDKFFKYLRRHYPSFSNATPAEIMTTLMVDNGVNYPSFKKLYKAYKEIGEPAERIVVANAAVDDPYAYVPKIKSVKHAKHKPVSTYVPEPEPVIVPEPVQQPSHAMHFKYIPLTKATSIPKPKTTDEQPQEFGWYLNRLRPFGSFGPISTRRPTGP